ncbi:hypothetical protein [Streptomyces sp. NPDC021212]|uniref:hypothetical protein n=1 Tax=Streptomyces sp. NPDC021212 TaxID=3365118 RepID=UPI0037AE2C15
MHMELGSVQEYVVKTDPGAVARARASLLRALPRTAWAGLIGTVCVLLLLGGAFSLVFASGADSTFGTELVLVLVLSGALLQLREGKRRFAAIRRLRQTWAVKEISPVAMRVTGEGLWCVLDAAPEPVFLPWAAVTHLQVKKRERLSVLMVALVPDAATAPGVTGLDQPEVRSRTQRNRKGVSRLHLAVFPLLRHPVSETEIDRALGHFSGGRVRVR